MTTITFNLPEGYKFVSKIRVNGVGREIAYDPAKMHETWIIRFLEKGMARYANDKYSSFSAETKFDLCATVAKESMNGEPAPVVTRGGTARLPDDVSLALKLARQALTIVFKKVSGKGKVADYADHEKIAPFFTAKGDLYVWNNETVQAWIDKQKETGKCDYLAEARASLDVDDSDLELDL